MMTLLATTTNLATIRLSGAPVPQHTCQESMLEEMRRIALVFARTGDTLRHHGGQPRLSC